MRGPSSPAGATAARCSTTAASSAGAPTRAASSAPRRPTWSPRRCGRGSTCARSPLAAGRERTCALDEEGGVFCWGSDGQGQIGTGRQ
ncbi:hypothetical protein [Sorangium sp. So ce381]|uniref:hypothetical protein n=1 Tax=Sorangium sp. So ce381 TaxID=3133307 RepID=UPI003F5B148C